MQRKFTLWALMLVLTMGLSAWAADGQGQGERRGGADGPRRGPGSFLRHALSKLDLTEDQHAAIRELVKAHRVKAEAWREQHKDELQPLFEKLREARKNQDREVAREVMVKIRELHQSGPNPEELLEKIKGQLTEPQQAQLQKLVEQARERMKQRGDGDRPNRREKRQGDDN